jgi:hypothetical protein
MCQIWITEIILVKLHCIQCANYTLVVLILSSCCCMSGGCDSQISNFAGKTPLWITRSSEVFKTLMLYSPADVCERILSDDIDEEQNLDLIHCLIQQYNWNPNDGTKNGDTALHLACKANRLNISSQSMLSSMILMQRISSTRHQLNSLLVRT